MDHKAYKLIVDGRAIVFLPTLGKCFEVSPEKLDELPDYITADDSVKPVVKKKYTSATLVLTDDCNLACSYCYEFGKPRRDPITMSVETIEKAIKSLVGRAVSEKTSGVRLYFFGGEPTLRLDEIIYAKQLLDKKCGELGLKTRYCITTNCCMSDEAANWVMENIDSIGISFDGNKRIQDRQRDMSFDQAFDRAKQFFSVCGSKKVSIRVTVSLWSARKMEEIVSFFAASFPGVKIYLEPLFKIGRGKTTSLEMPNPDRFFNGCLACYKLAKTLGVDVVTSIGKPRNDTPYFCGAHGGGQVFAPNGEVLTCPRMSLSCEPGRDFFVCGEITNDGIVFDRAKTESLASLLDYSKIPKCADCFARYACRGDCPANKAVINQATFFHEPSYRCEAIKRFVSKLLLLELDSS